MNPFSVHERASAFDDLPPSPRVDLVPLQAGEPLPERLTVASTARVGRVLADWIIALTRDQHLVEPDAVSFYPTRAHVWFRDENALGTTIAWAEQLDAEFPAIMQVDRFGDRHAIVITGTVTHVEVLLHVVTKAALPDRALDLAELRRHIDADRYTRGVSDVPAVLPEGAAQ